MPAKRNKNLKYRRMPYTEIEKILSLLVDKFRDFLTLKGFSENIKYHISYYDLIDIIIRVDKRKAYYLFFHDMEINECKEVALYAYWILKLRPFTITDNAYKNNAEACCINESFAIYFIGLVLELTHRIKHTKNIKESYSRFLEYSFRFRNFSIDSFIVLVESITTETLEKEYPYLYDKPE
jgi:hypothetical protein